TLASVFASSRSSIARSRMTVCPSARRTRSAAAAEPAEETKRKRPDGENKICRASSARPIPIEATLPEPASMRVTDLGTLSRFLRRLPDPQLPQLLVGHLGGGLHHQVEAGGRLRKRDHVADRRGAGREGADPVEAERDASVRGRAVTESVEQEAEAMPSLLGGDAEQAKDALLNVGAVDSDRARPELPAVQDDIVRPRPHPSPLA